MVRTFWKQKCQATCSQSGLPCKNWAMDHQTVCDSHGGQAPQNKHAALVRKRLDQAGRRVKNADPILDPYWELALLNGKKLAVANSQWDKIAAGNADKVDIDAFLKAANDAERGLDTQGRAAMDERRFLVQHKIQGQVGQVLQLAWANTIVEAKRLLPPDTHPLLDQVLRDHTRTAFEDAVSETKRAIEGERETESGAASP
jgi:hypothetical protein